MAIYHCSVKTISRACGRSATAAAAYRAGDKIKDERTGEIHDYTKKQGVLNSEIIVPSGAPKWNRETLWNEAEKAEKRKNSTVAREYELALPEELNKEQQLELSREFAVFLTSTYGVAADICIHAPSRFGDDRNTHVHILTSTRRISAEGFGEKTRELDGGSCGREQVEKIREKWAELTNRALERVGTAERIDHRSLSEQGIDQEPTIHLGVAASALERRGMATERGDMNRAIMSLRKYQKELRELRENMELDYGQDLPLGASQKPTEAVNLKNMSVVSVKGAENVLEAPGGKVELKNHKQEVEDLNLLKDARIYESPKPGIYRGEIVHMADDFIVQKVGLKSLVIHDKKMFENPQALEIGKRVSISVSKNKKNVFKPLEQSQSLGR